jgi:3-hydroxyacyl-CoA dehydrogenase
VLLLARSDRSAERARETVEDTPTRLGAGVDPAHVQVVTDINALATATFVLEAVVEDQEVKAALLFSAVRLLEETGMDPLDIDTCMRLGAGQPMGPLALLDLVGLDVSKAIGEAVGERAPARVDQLIDEGALGRKSGRGFFGYGRAPAKRQNIYPQ